MNRLLRPLLLTALAVTFLGVGSKAVFADGTINIAAITATPDATSFTVQWTTDVAASSIVQYSTDTSYSNATTEADTNPRVTQHSVTVSGLQSCTTYHFVTVSNALSYAETSAISSDQQVTTAGCANSTAIATAVPDGSLASTGNDTNVYLAGIGSLLLIILAVTQLNKR